MLRCIEAWFPARGLPFHALQGPGGETPGLYAELRGARGDGPRTVLDAPPGTAGFGGPATWSRPPTSAVLEGGWLHGRGSADSKAGVARVLKTALGRRRR